MKIALNILYLIPNKVGGTQTYAEGILKELNNRKNDITVFCNSEFYNISKSKYVNIKFIRIHLVGTSKILRILFENAIFPIIVFFKHFDLVHSLGYTCPFFLPAKNFVTIHDLNWYYHPEDFSKIEYYIWKILVSTSAKFSDHIITVSNSSKKSISDVLNIEQEKISTIYSGIHPIKIKKTKFIYSNYILTVTSLVPHKNVKLLLRSFKKSIKNGVNKKLIIVGLKGKDENDVMSYIKKNFKKEVIILGWVSEKFLNDLYAHADLFIFVSTYEGFGFPVLEAMNYSLPVISSDMFSLKEVIGQAAYVINPFSVSSISSSIIEVSGDKIISKKMSISSKKQASNFSWKLTADKLLEVYEKNI